MFKVKSIVAAGLAAAMVVGAATAASISASAHSRSPAAAPQVVRVSTTEFMFKVDTGGRVRAGLVELKLVNHGTVDHEALLARLHPGVTLARFEKALKASGPAAYRLVDFAGGAGAAAAGGSQDTVQALQGGHYAVLCLVAGPDGIPHVMKGMIAGLTVTGYLPPARLAALRPEGHVTGTITAHDMTYTLPAVIHGHGLYRFTDTDARDTHEFGIIRLGPGVTAADVSAWVRTPAGPPPFTSAGGYGAVPPGHGGWLRLDLAPGRYAAICFVPDDAPPHAPHAAMGMVVPFTVTR